MKTRSQKSLPKATRPHMPGYLAKSKKLLSWSWAEKKLSKSRQYWIITVRPDGRHPHAMPVWGLWLDEIFYFSTGSKTRKTKNIAKNSYCIVANEDAAEAVIVEGKAEAVKDPSLIRKVLSLYGRKYKFDMSGMADDMIALKEPLFAVHPDVVFGQIEKTFTKTATRWKFN
jgi:nitroimidazol reductase NimA-like FMN-containing flavoprotein (pyridoxamine 5'-phosphate oxidase superfamily)